MCNFTGSCSLCCVHSHCETFHSLVAMCREWYCEAVIVRSASMHLLPARTFDARHCAFASLIKFHCISIPIARTASLFRFTCCKFESTLIWRSVVCSRCGLVRSCATSGCTGHASQQQSATSIIIFSVHQTMQLIMGFQYFVERAPQKIYFTMTKCLLSSDDSW